MTTIYRPEQPGDMAAIQAVNQAAFPTEAEANLVDALRLAGRLVISFVAEKGGYIVGHIGFSPVTLSGVPEKRKGIGLAPLAILPAYQRLGIGSSLVHAGLVACQQAGFAYAVVLGEPHYYSRFGFAPASRFGLGNEYGAQDEFMALALQPGGIPTIAGVVRYAPEFVLVE